MISKRTWKPSQNHPWRTRVAENVKETEKLKKLDKSIPAPKQNLNLGGTMSFNTIEFEATVLTETEKALRVDIDNTDYWLPKTQISEDSEVQGEGDAGTLIVSRWWAAKEGLFKSEGK